MKIRSNGNPAGFRDLSAKETKLKTYIISAIEGVYRQYGFQRIETSIVEFTSTLVNEVSDFNLFNVVPSRQRQQGIAEEMSLRFDHTVPLARYVVDNMGQIPLPFKRYCVGPVFRGETPGKGRYRQFDQMDLDIVGSSHIFSDIEILLAMNEVMATLVESDFTISVNTRKLLNCLPALFDFPESDLKKVLVELDKRDKVSSESLIISLIELGLTMDNAMKLTAFGAISGKPTDVLNQIKDICGEIPEASEAISDLSQIEKTLLSLNITNIQFDMAVIRGLSYYTGTVFETKLHKTPEYGSVYSGGRYDGLVESFGVQALPAVGASVGVDRLVAALSSISYDIPTKKPTIIVLLQDPSVFDYATKIARKARSAGYICEIYTGNKTKLVEQFTYADKVGYDYTMVVGSEEKNTETIQIKNQKTRLQHVAEFNFPTAKIQ